MKDTTIKKTYIFLVAWLLTSVGHARVYNNIDEVILQDSGKGKHGAVKKKPKKKKIKDIKLTKDKKGYFDVPWEVLSEYDSKKKKTGKNLKKVINKKVVIKGFVIPLTLDKSAKNMKEFLLVPYIPSCAHVPPPPPNMIVKVKSPRSKKVKASWWTVIARGKLSILKPSKKQVDPYMPNGVYALNAVEVVEVK